MAPPPPPPPLCFPSFNAKKPKRRLSWSSAAPDQLSGGSYDSKQQLVRADSYSPTQTLTGSRQSLTFHSDSEKYDEVPDDVGLYRKASKKSQHSRSNTFSGPTRPTLGAALMRGNTQTGTKKSSFSSRLGYGWSLGRKDKPKELEPDISEKSSSNTVLAPAIPPGSPLRRGDSRSTQASRSTQKSKSSQNTASTSHSKGSVLPIPPPPGVRPRYNPHDSSDTLIGSAFERKIYAVDDIPGRVDTTDRLLKLRGEMQKDNLNLDYYIVPSEDAHGSEYVAVTDKRREYISGFSGSAGQAIVTRTNAYLITDSRYWLQAKDQLDRNWQLVEAGKPGQPKDWVEWLLGRVKESRIGLDARMITHEKAAMVNSKLGPLSSKLVFPPQNLVDLVWTDKPAKVKNPVFLQPIEFTGKHATQKIAKVREWVRAQPPEGSGRTVASPSRMHVGTLITALPAIAYLLNVRGSDIPYNPLFQAYLFIGLDRSYLFVDHSKIVPEVSTYLKSIDVEERDYIDLWSFLRRREWGDGKLLISPQTSYAISLMLTHFRYTVEPSYIEQLMAIKNETEIEGMKRAYLRDGASYVRWLAWLEDKINGGYDITEFEAATRLTEFRRKNKYFMGLAYQNISASGAHAALPHYSPKKADEFMIDRNLPYLNDSGGQYRDGTCDTTRTVHFGRPTPEMCEAYTRVLQGHIAIDSAVYPEGTSGYQLDVLARKALWKDGLNYMHGTGHGFGSFLTVHEGPQGFSSSVALTPGHVITNEPGFYKAGKWGMRIESALVVRRVQTKHNFNGNVWLGFERLTCVPIQTRMVNESMLTKEEKAWLKDHNKTCYDRLAPVIKDDSRAMKWLKRESDRGIGLASKVAGVASIDWD